MKASVLIIEDVREMAELIDMYLAKEGIVSTICETAESGLVSLRETSYDLIILDLNLPGMDGFEFLGRVRKSSNIPVIIVSARDSDEDLVMGLGIGADEFVTKPFSPKVLAARVRAALRRAANTFPGTKDLCFGPFTLDIEAYLLKKDGKRISLSTKEFEVLAFLASHPGKPLSPETIYGEVWKNAFGDLTAVAVYVQRIRKKIEEDPANPKYIETVHGMGYVFRGEEGNRK